SAWCVVKPGESTTPHSHPDGETFFIIDGRGLMTIGQERSEVARGSVIYIPSHSDHTLKNLSETEELVFVTVWWDGPNQKASAPKRALVIPAPPTPNGDLHVGHLSGPYLAADFYARFLKMRGS